jgi:hypothetical protein
MIVIFVIYVLIMAPLIVIDITIFKSGALTGLLLFYFIFMCKYALEELIEYISINKRNRR